MADAQIKITADTRQAERALADLDKAVSSIKDSSATAAKALAGITAAAGAMTYAILRTINAAGDLIDASDRLGISAQSLQQLQQAAQLAGVGADQLNASIQRLSANIGEGIAKGTGPAVDALNRLGLPLNEIARLKPDDQFKRISEELLKIENPAQRTAASMELFGKQGPAIVKVAEELEKVRRITEATGLIVTERDLVALDEASDAVDQLGILWDASVKKAVVAVTPAIIAIVEAIKQAIVNAGGFEGIWQKIISTLRTVINIALILGTVLVTRVAAGAALVAANLVKAAIAARSLNVILSRTPIGLLTAGAAILADKMGVDLVGGAEDFLDINLDIKGAQDQINVAFDERISKQTQTVELAKQYNEEQKKALDALDKLIAGKNNEISALRTRITLGQEEANIAKLVGEQEQKLLEAKLNLTDKEVAAKLKSFEISVRQEALLKRIVDRQQEVNAAITGGMDPDRVAVIESYNKLQKAQEDFIQALALGDQAVIESARKQMQILDMAYQNQIIKTARSKVEILRIEDEHAKKIENINANLNNLINLGFTEEAELYRLLQAEKLKIAEETAAKLESLEMARIEKVLMAERNAIAANLDDREKSFLQKLGEEEKQRSVVAERIAFEKKSDLDKMKWSLDNMQTVFAALGAQNKKAFEASKALAIASALVNTYQGATKALATYPWPFGLIAAAAAVAAGLAQVSAIRSQQYSGRALGGPVMGGKSYIVGESGPELFTPSTTGSITRNNQLGGGGSTNINFTIVANDTEGFDQLLTSRRGVIQQIISDAMLERGQRM